MKTLKILIIMICALSIISCNSSKGPDITGTYVSTYQNEYSTGNDTLLITAFNTDGGIYQIERRTGYQKIREGKMLPREFKKVKWTATYDNEKQVLNETEYGRKIYMKEGQKLLFGSTGYQRLK
jgi:hypothetical protein